MTKKDKTIDSINNMVFNSNLDNNQQIELLEKIAEYSISELNKMCESSFFEFSKKENERAKKSLDKIQLWFL